MKKDTHPEWPEFEPMFNDILLHIQGLANSSWAQRQPRGHWVLIIHMKHNGKNLNDFPMYPKGSEKYYALWTELIKQCEFVFYAVANPTDEMKQLQKMLWEV